MTRAPTISVAIATYQGARFLREQLDSIYVPCSVDFEVVVSDDGSTDGTHEILGAYAAKFGLRNVSDGQHRGLVKNFENALFHCRGEFVALCDQDDIWYPDRLNGLLQSIGECSAVYSLIDRVLLPDGSRATWIAPPGIREYAKRYGTGRPMAELIASNWIISHTMFLRRKVLEAALPIPTGQPFQDGWIGLAAAGLGGIRYIEPSATLYRIHPASHTAIVARPPSRRLLGVYSGLPREDWLKRCRAEIIRLEECVGARFVPEAERRFALRLQDYYRRGLRRGVDFRTGYRAFGLVARFYSSFDARWRRNFVLRGFFGAI